MKNLILIIEDCNISLNYTKIGTIAGINNGKIINCSTNNGSITSNADNDGSRIGGIVGQNGEEGEVINCTNNINVTAEYKLVGGIVGYNLGGNIENCYNSGIVEIKSESNLVGGLFGGIDTNFVGKEVVENCYYLDITCDKSCGNEESLGGVEEAKAVTSEELKSIYKDSGEEFKENKDGDMYPKLIWE